MFLKQLADFRTQVAPIAKEVLTLDALPQMTRQTGGQGLTYLVNESHIIKFALRLKEVEPLQNMVALLEVLRPYLKTKTDVAVPDIHAGTFHLTQKTDRRAQEVSVLYACYELIKGEIHYERNFRFLPYRQNVMEQLGDFLGHLHQFPYQKYPYLQIQSHKDVLNETIPMLVEFFEDEMGEGKKSGLNTTLRNKLLNGVCHDLFAKEPSVLCHYDLMPRNVCLNGQRKKVAGVIDFGSAVLAPRAFEGMGVHYDMEDLKLMDKAYAAVTGKSLLLSHRKQPFACLMDAAQNRYRRIKGE